LLRHVQNYGGSKAAEQINEARQEDKPGSGVVPQERRPNTDNKAQNSCADECGHETGIDYGDVDGVYCRDGLCGRNPS